MSDIVITNWNNHITIFAFHEDKLCFLKIADNNDRTGNIYVGRVENIVSNLEAAFVRFEAGNKKHGIGFLPIKNLEPEFVLNRTFEKGTGLRQGDNILVMVRTEEQKTKQSRLTCDIRHISKSDAFLGDNKAYKNLEELLSIARTRCDYQLLFGNDSSCKNQVIDAKTELERRFCDEFRVVTDLKEIYNELKDDFNSFFYNEDERRLPLAIHYSLTSKTDDLFKKKVWLNSGSYLVIEQTETLNLIDVNSGKNLKNKNKMFLEINKEAAKEAYRQVLLRNLSGMILIDFIDLDSKEANQELIDFVVDLIKDDTCNMRYIDLTGLGIMEFTRDKRTKSLREIVS